MAFKDCIEALSKAAGRELSDDEISSIYDRLVDAAGSLGKLQGFSEGKLKSDIYKSAGTVATKNLIQEAEHLETKMLLELALSNAMHPDSSAFKEWFGNSQIVDDEGEPMIVYKAMMGDIPNMSSTGLTHVAIDERVATAFSQNGKPVQQVFVKAENPFDFRNLEHLHGLLDIISQPAFIDEINQYYWEINGYGDQGIDQNDVHQIDQRELEGAVESGAWQILEVPAVVEVIKDLGYDSFYVLEDGQSRNSPNIALFSRSQIKSVGNLGTWDPRHDSIFHQAAKFSGLNENFWAWFKKSAVVDKEGRPLPVYHGTPKSFDAFRGEAWFAENPDMAARFGQGRRGDWRKKRGNNMMKVYLSIQNPVDLTGLTIERDISAVELAKAIGIPLEKLDARARKFGQIEADRMNADPEEADSIKMMGKWKVGTMGSVYMGSGREAYESRMRVWEWLDNDSLTKALESFGFDGIKTREIHAQMTPRARVNKDVESVTWMTFRPEQVKSAISNTGTWSSSNPNILFQSVPKSDIGHKREKKTGRYVGAPDKIGNNPRMLVQMRRVLRQLAVEGEPGRYWYRNSSQAVLDIFSKDKTWAEKFSGLISIYSQGTNVKTNILFAVQAYYQWKSGQQIRTGRFPETQTPKTQAWLGKGEDWGGVKTNNFYLDLMEEIDPSKVDEEHATMDMWMALAFDYGKKVLDQGPKYHFAKREIISLAKQMGWKPHEVQAAIWVAFKARAEATRADHRKAALAKGLKPNSYEWFRLAHKMAMDAPFDPDAITESKYDYRDGLADLMVQLSWEATPSTKTGHSLPGIHADSTQRKFEYLQAIQGVLFKDGVNVVADLVGIPPGATIQGFSAWKGAIGAGAQSFIPVPISGTRSGRHIRPAAIELLDLYADVIGYVLEQDSVAYHAPVFDESHANRNGIQIMFPRPLNENEMADLYNAIIAKFGTEDLAPAYRLDGVRVLNFAKGLSNKAFKSGMEEVLEALPPDFGGGGVRAATFRSDGTLREEVMDGKSYLDRIEERRPDILGRVAALRADVQAVNRSFEKKYGWDKAPPQSPGGQEAPPVTLYQSAYRPIWYSALARGVESAKQDSAPAKDWLPIISKIPGIKKAEIEAVGLPDWLALQKGNVSREAVLNFVRNNGVQLEEVWKVPVLGRPAVSFGEWQVVEPDPEWIADETNRYLNDMEEEYRSNHDIAPDAELDQRDKDNIEEMAREEAMEDYYRSWAGHTLSVDVEMQRNHDAETFNYTVNVNSEGDMEIVREDGSTLYSGRKLDEAQISHEVQGDAEGIYAREHPDLAEEGSDNAAQYDNPNWMEPGPHEGYREVLLTIPQQSAKEQARSLYAKLKEDHGGDKEGYSAISNTEMWIENHPDDPLVKELNRLRGVADDSFVGPHWEEENVVVHARANARKYRDAKIWFIEEMQSDWAHKGYELGFRNDRIQRTPVNMLPGLQEWREENGIWILPIRNAEGKERVLARVYNVSQITDSDLKLTYRRWTPESNVLEFQQYEGNTPGPGKQAPYMVVTHTSIEQYKAAARNTYVFTIGDRSNAFDRLYMTEQSATMARVPSAPFVTDPKAWVTLIMKRMIRHAAENGYDTVAWTTGKQQNDRWNVARYVDVLSIKRTGENEWNWSAMKSGHSGIHNQTVTKEKMTDTFGKELSKQFLALPVGESKDLRGKDLQVGGHGLKILYDDIIPSAVNAFLKKYGLKVEMLPVSRNMQPGFRLTDQMREDALAGFPLFQKKDENRGAISWDQNRQFLIQLFQKADKSTFLHESGHFFLEMMGEWYDEVAKVDPQLMTAEQKKFVQDYAGILKWLGVENKSQITREHHEKWARGIELYLYEGKAPSAALRSAFARFREWLIQAYRLWQKTVSAEQALDVRLNDEIRGIMDRMLATEEEIQQAKEEMGFSPLITKAGDMGMTDAEFAPYKKAVEAANLEAKERLQEKLLREMTREKEKWWKERRAEVRAVVEKEVNRQRVYQVDSLLRTGKDLDGNPLPGGIRVRLSRDAVAKAYGAKIAERLNRYLSKTGIAPDVAAETLGYQSGDEMISELKGMQDKRSLIEAETDIRMREQYGDMMNDGTITEVAKDSLTGDSMVKVLEAEIAALKRKAAEVRPFVQAAKKEAKEERRRGLSILSSPMARLGQIKAMAEGLVAQKRVSDLNPNGYLQAVRKASKEAVRLAGAGDFEGALIEKQRQLLNLELYRVAVKAKEDVEAGVKAARAAFRSDEKMAKSHNMDMVSAARSILSAHALGRSDAAPEQYLANIRRYDPETYENLMELVEPSLASRRPYKEMAVEDFRAMMATVDGLLDLARRDAKMMVDGQLVDRADVIEELNAALAQKTEGKERLGYQRGISKWEDFKIGLVGARAALTRVVSWVDLMDNGNPQGIFRKYLYNPVIEAIDTYRVEKKKVLEKYLGEIVKPLEGRLSNKKIEAREIGYTFTNKSELLGALLHTGNESNLEKLLVGRGWGQLREDGSLDTSRWDAFLRRAYSEQIITRPDYEFAQGVWDLLESLKPAAQKAHKTMYGTYFAEITAKEIQTPWGSYRGGYVPASVDPRMSVDADIRQDQATLLEESTNTFMFPAAARGFTKRRVQGYHRPLTLDLGLLPNHIDKVLKFAYIGPAVRDVSRIVTNASFRDALSQLDPKVGKDMLVPWLQRSVKQIIQQPGKSQFVDRMASYLRRNSGAQIMVLNVINTLQQFTGLSIAAVKVKPRNLARALFMYTTSPKETTRLIAEKSKFMSTRTSAQVFEIQSRIDSILLDPNKYQKAKDWAGQHGYFMQAATQNVVDVISWMGAYHEAVADGMNEKEAVRHADSVVRQTQGSFSPEDISSFEAGTPFVRAFTMFYSYFNMQANILGTEFAKVAQNMGLKAGAGRAFYVYLFAFMVPAVMSEVIRAAIAGIDDDDDDGPMDDWMWLFFTSQGRTLAAFAPGVGPAALAAVNAFNKKWYDDRITTSPVVSVIESAARAPHSVYKALVDDKGYKRAVQDVLTLVGLLTGLPTASLARPLGYLAAVEEGKAHPENEMDYVRGLMSGRDVNR